MKTIEWFVCIVLLLITTACASSQKIATKIDFDGDDVKDYKSYSAYAEKGYVLDSEVAKYNSLKRVAPGSYKNMPYDQGLLPEANSIFMATTIGMKIAREDGKKFNLVRLSVASWQYKSTNERLLIVGYRGDDKIVEAYLPLNPNKFTQYNLTESWGNVDLDYVRLRSPILIDDIEVVAIE